MKPGLKPTEVLVTRAQSSINYSYFTIRLTRSRIEKGLIAIPKQLSDMFPDENSEITIYSGWSGEPEIKRYSSFRSTTKENRIGGMSRWFTEKGVKAGDEVVVQVLDKERFIYRIIPEKEFITRTRELERELDNAEKEETALQRINDIADWTRTTRKMAALGEFRRIVEQESLTERQYVRKNSNLSREGVPHHVRALLEEIYQGHCQVCDFTFLKRDGRPYFEIHHINPEYGNHPKNLVLVCANCHRQFEYSDVHHYFNPDRWLTRVSFNGRKFVVKQAYLQIKYQPVKHVFT